VVWGSGAFIRDVVYDKYCIVVFGGTVVQQSSAMVLVLELELEYGESMVQKSH
jgi:hypothetical protein